MAAEILTTTTDPSSNSTVDLMIRAMIDQVRPYLPRLSPDKRNAIRLRLKRTCHASPWLPVEKAVMQEIYRLTGRR